MKKIIAIAMVMIMSLCLFSGCSNSKSTYKVGETAECNGLEFTLTNTEYGTYCDNVKSENGSWVRVWFDIKNVSDETKTIYCHDFTMNDSYTEYDFAQYEYGFSGRELKALPNNTYEICLTYDCKYNQSQKDMSIKYESSFAFVIKSSIVFEF